MLSQAQFTVMSPKFFAMQNNQTASCIQECFAIVKPMGSHAGKDIIGIFSKCAVSDL
jgi:hypothetical protein